MRAIWIPHSDIPEDQRVAVDANPDAQAHELLDILEIVDQWLAEGAGPAHGPTDQ
jgi:putative hydrolase of the HAD superfamily